MSDANIFVLLKNDPFSYFINWEFLIKVEDPQRILKNARVIFKNLQGSPIIHENIPVTFKNDLGIQSAG